MAGLFVQDRLRAKDFEHFHHLLSSLTDPVLNTLDHVYLNGALLIRILEQEPRMMQDRSVQVKSAAFTTLAKEASQEIHRYFYPKLGSEGMELNRTRWQPFDENVWDNLMEGMIALLQPFIAKASNAVHEIDKLPRHETSHSNLFTTALIKIRQHLDHLSGLLTVEGIDAYLSNNLNKTNSAPN